MKLAIVGSRTFTDYNKLKSIVDDIRTVYHIDSIISGGCSQGTDKLGKRYAKEHKINYVEFPANWSIGKHAGHLRNTDIVNESQIVLACWDGSSTGTENVINTTKSIKNKILLLYNTYWDKLDFSVNDNFFDKTLYTCNTSARNVKCINYQRNLEFMVKKFL